MPGGDRTGPMGAGPRTGRAVGYCAGFDGPGYMNPGPGRGFGAGRGRFGGFRGAGRGGRPWGGGRGRVWGGGRGWGWRGNVDPYYADYEYPGDPYPPPMNKEEEIGELKAQADYLKSTLEDIDKRLKELTTDKTDKK